MAKMEQPLEDQSESYSEKLERAKQLYQIYNNITFGSEEDSTNSRYLLQKIT